MTFYVYILQSDKDGRFYIGQTQNLNSRLENHNSGKSRYTRGKGPLKLFAVREANNRSEAILIEKKLKNLKSIDRIIDFIDKHNFIRY